jgi:FkbM family methyltransferase
MLRMSGGMDDHRWKQAVAKVVRGKWHGYEMQLNLSNWSERQTYFLGRYYDLPGQLLLRSLLRPHGQFVDIGANIGMLTLLAARLVGPRGMVISIEPNPVAMRRLQSMIRANDLSQIEPHRVGLSDTAGKMKLQVVGEHTGLSTFRSISPDQRSQISAEYEVDVILGDSILAGRMHADGVMKIDVEGFECHVLKGLSQTLSTARPTLVMEVVPWYLWRAQSRMNELCSICRGYGYEGFVLETCQKRLRHRLALKPVEQLDKERIYNLVWIHSDSPHRELIKDFIQ